MLEILSLNEERNIQVVEEAAMQAKEERIYASRASLSNCLGIHIKTVKTVTPIWTDSLCFTKNEICGDLHE